MVRDIAALNKMPLLPWDGWGLIDSKEQDISYKDLALLDQCAEASMAGIDYSAVRTLYASDNRLRVPLVIHSYTDSGILNVEVSSEEPLDQAV